MRCSLIRAPHAGRIDDFGEFFSYWMDQEEVEEQVMGRVMGIDWGERRIGVALSDESRTIASPHTVIKRSHSLDRDLDRIAEMAVEYEVELVLFGLPRRLDGSMGPAAEGVLEIVEKLRGKVEAGVDSWDERMSTIAAERALIGGDVSRRKRKSVIDQVAAALFLQSYLDMNQGPGSGV